MRPRAAFKLSPLTMLLTVSISTATQAIELQEVTVTAQKRVESLQDAPIAINAYDANNIESMGLFSAKDVGLTAPSLQMPAYPTTSNNLALFIRGIGNADSISLTKDSTVGIYYDGVYASRSTGLLADLADLERIEILRGPQGTLYGRNTTAGAINFINARPTGEFNWKQTLTAGNFGTLRSVSNVNLPTIGGLKAKLTFAHTERDGWVENAGAGQVPGVDYADFYAEEKSGIRLALRYDVIEDVVIDYAFDSADMDTGSPYFQYSGPIGGTNAAGAAITNSYTTRIKRSRSPVGGAQTAYTLPTTETEVQGHNLTIAVDINENLSFKSITGYREFDDDASTSFAESFGGAGSFEVNVITDHEQISQELQLLGSYDEIQYVAGFYYFEEDATQIESQYLDRATVDTAGIFALDVLAGFAPCSIFGVGGNGAGGVAAACTDPFGAGTTFPLYLGQYTMESDIESMAVFGQATWTPAALDNKLDVTVGLRYTEDERETTRVNDGWAFNSFGPGATRSDIDKVDWSLIFDYSLAENFSTYIKAASAFRSGGAGRNSLNYNNGFDEETLLSYELGWKAELADRRIRFNGAIFQMNIDDIILDYLPDPVNNPQFVEVFNSGQAEVNGAEVDILALVAEGFTIGVNYAYLDHEVQDAIFPDGSDRTQTTELVWAPEHAYSIITDYSLPLDFGTLQLHLDYSWQHDQLALANTNFGKVEVEAFGLLNARIGIADIGVGNGKLQFAIWSRNLANADDVNYRIGATSTTHLQPRTFGADIIYEIGAK